MHQAFFFFSQSQGAIWAAVWAMGSVWTLKGSSGQFWSFIQLLFTLQEMCSVLTPCRGRRYRMVEKSSAWNWVRSAVGVCSLQWGASVWVAKTSVKEVTCGVCVHHLWATQHRLRLSRRRQCGRSMFWGQLCTLYFLKDRFFVKLITGVEQGLVSLLWLVLCHFSLPGFGTLVLPPLSGVLCHEGAEPWWRLSPLSTCPLRADWNWPYCGWHTTPNPPWRFVPGEPRSSHTSHGFPLKGKLAHI